MQLQKIDLINDAHLGSKPLQLNQWSVPSTLQMASAFFKNQNSTNLRSNQLSKSPQSTAQRMHKSKSHTGDKKFCTQNSVAYNEQTFEKIPPLEEQPQPLELGPLSIQVEFAQSTKTPTREVQAPSSKLLKDELINLSQNLNQPINFRQPSGDQSNEDVTAEIMYFLCNPLKPSAAVTTNIPTHMQSQNDFNNNFSVLNMSQKIVTLSKVGCPTQPSQPKIDRVP